MKFSREMVHWMRWVVAVDVMVITAAIFMDLVFGMDQFGELGVVTWLSVALLLLNSWFAYQVFQIRYLGGQSWNVPATIWGLISFGCIFLAADEFFCIHESVDEWLHWKFQKEETALSDRLDDLLIGVYMLGALVVMAFYRNELSAFFQLWPWLVIGFSFAVVMVLLDALTNRQDILPLFFDDPKLARIIHLGICGTEDILKIMAISTFTLMHFRARELAESLRMK